MAQKATSWVCPHSAVRSVTRIPRLLVTHSSFGTDSYNWKEPNLSDAALEIIRHYSQKQQDSAWWLPFTQILRDPRCVSHPILPLVDLPAAAGIWQALGSTELGSCVLQYNTGGTILWTGNTHHQQMSCNIPYSILVFPIAFLTC